MRTNHKLALAAALAALVLAVAGGVAAANRSLFVEPAGAVRATARSLTFAWTEETYVICEVQLELSLHGTVPKVRDTLAGLVTAGSVSGCRETALGTVVMRLLFEPTWHLRWQSFTGVLPNITGVLLNAVEWRWLVERTVLSISSKCLFRGTIGMQMPIEAGGRATSLRLLAATVPLFAELRGGFPCPREMLAPAGSFQLSAAQTVRLV